MDNADIITITSMLLMLKWKIIPRSRPAQIAYGVNTHSWKKLFIVDMVHSLVLRMLRITTIPVETNMGLERSIRRAKMLV